VWTVVPVISGKVKVFRDYRQKCANVIIVIVGAGQICDVSFSAFGKLLFHLTRCGVR